MSEAEHQHDRDRHRSADRRGKVQSKDQGNDGERDRKALDHLLFSEPQIGELGTSRQNPHSTGTVVPSQARVNSHFWTRFRAGREKSDPSDKYVRVDPAEDLHCQSLSIALLSAH